MRLFGFADKRREAELSAITRRRQEFSAWSNEQLRSAARNLSSSPDVAKVFALTAVIAERVLGL